MSSLISQKSSLAFSNFFQNVLISKLHHTDDSWVCVDSTLPAAEEAFTADLADISRTVAAHQV